MFSDPRHIIEQFGHIEGKSVADLGAGSGFYSIEAARAVGPTGKVFAIDIQGDMLDRLKREGARLSLKNIEVVKGDLEFAGGTHLASGSIDSAILANALFTMEDKKGALAEASRIVKKGGRLLLVDWSGSFGQIGPHSDHVVYKDDAMKLAKEAGFAAAGEVNAGSHHYGIIFRKA